MSLYNLLKSSLNFDYGKYSSGELGIRESEKKEGFYPVQTLPDGK